MEGEPDPPGPPAAAKFFNPKQSRPITINPDSINLSRTFNTTSSRLSALHISSSGLSPGTPILLRHHGRSRRASWRIISSIEQKEESRGNESHVSSIKSYRSKIKAELCSICDGILKLIGSASNGDSKVFYLKLKDDYHRYLAEFKTGAERKEAAEKTPAAEKAPAEKKPKAEKKLPKDARVACAARLLSPAVGRLLRRPPESPAPPACCRLLHAVCCAAHREEDKSRAKS